MPVSGRQPEMLPRTRVVVGLKAVSSLHPCLSRLSLIAAAKRSEWRWLVYRTSGFLATPSVILRIRENTQQARLVFDGRFGVWRFIRLPVESEICFSFGPSNTDLGKHPT